MIECRKTRFHDEKGHLVDLQGLVYAPVALGTALLRKAFGYRPKYPSLSFRAIATIDQLLQPDHRCVEFGSGMSTPWLAARCGFLLSIENNKDWHRRVDAMIGGSRYSHIRYEMRDDARFADLSEYDDGFFDFALVDGWDRHGCVLSVAPKIRPGGWIYLDNTDKDMTRPDGDLRRAEAALLEAVRERGGSTRYFVDFATGNFFVEQGVLARL